MTGGLASLRNESLKGIPAITNIFVIAKMPRKLAKEKQVAVENKHKLK